MRHLEALGPQTAPPDPLIRALARYIAALHRRYPDGPAELGCHVRPTRANMRPMVDPTERRAS